MCRELQIHDTHSRTHTHSCEREKDGRENSREIERERRINLSGGGAFAIEFAFPAFYTHWLLKTTVGRGGHCLSLQWRWAKAISWWKMGLSTMLLYRWSANLRVSSTVFSFQPMTPPPKKNRRHPSSKTTQNKQIACCCCCCFFVYPPFLIFSFFL